MPMYPPSLPPSQSCPLSLSSATLLDVFLGHVDEVYVIKQVRNGFLLAGSRGPKIDIQIPYQQQFTRRGASSPGGTKVIHPHRISGGDICTYHKKSNSPRDQLEHQHIGGGNFHCLNLKVLMSCCPKQSNPPLLWTYRLQRNHMIPLNVLGVLGVSELGLG
jgi:hypothetical protein